MKALNNFLVKAPLWQVYIFGWLFSGAFMASLFYLLPSTPELDFSGIKSLKVGVFSGLIFGLMMLMVSMMRKSSEFWTYAEEVEAAIEKANSKEDLEAIFENDFQTLRKMSQGRPHTQELTKLYHIMKTKHKYVS
jgi:hypothetical protein